MNPVGMIRDFTHNAAAERNREAKVDQIVEFMLATRINILPEGRDRRAVEKAACGRRCSDETWNRAIARWRLLNSEPNR